MTWIPPAEPSTSWAVKTPRPESSTPPTESAICFTKVSKPPESHSAVMEWLTTWATPPESIAWGENGKALLCESGEDLLTENDHQQLWLEDKPWSAATDTVQETWVKKSQA